MFGERTWTRLVSQSCHGRVTIPIEFRRTLGILDEEILEMTLGDGELRIRRLKTPASEESITHRRSDASRQPAPP